MKYLRFNAKKISGDYVEVLLNLDKVEKIEFFQDNYFKTPQYYIYINNVSISGNEYLNKDDYYKFKELILKAIGNENIYATNN